MYLDCNNLYGDSLSKYLPFRNFNWINQKNKSKEESEAEASNTLAVWTDIILNKKDNDKIGYIFEVDLKYPQNLHNLHRDLPLAPEH